MAPLSLSLLLLSVTVVFGSPAGFAATNFGCEQTIVVKNLNKDNVTVYCGSDESQGVKAMLSFDKEYIVTFRPPSSGTFYCTLQHRGSLFRFDAYNPNKPEVCARQCGLRCKYVVRDDGIYAPSVVTMEDRRFMVHGHTKVVALTKGRHKFQLWESYEDGEPDGLIQTAYVDKGMCIDVPDDIGSAVAAVTLCDGNACPRTKHCIRVYGEYGCGGASQTIEGTYAECPDVPMIDSLVNNVRAIEGC